MNIMNREGNEPSISAQIPPVFGSRPRSAGAAVLGKIGSFFGVTPIWEKENKAKLERLNQQIFSARQAGLARQYNTAMVNTAHEREVNDLIAAGLNPILSANKGAASIGSPMASATQAPTERPENFNEKMITSVISATGKAVGSAMKFAGKG